MKGQNEIVADMMVSIFKCDEKYKSIAARISMSLKQGKHKENHTTAYHNQNC